MQSVPTCELPDAQEADQIRVPFGAKWRSIGLALLPYGAVAVLSCILLVFILELWKADLRVAFDDRGDSLWVNSWIKCTQENGWFLHNPLLGAPGGSYLYDFPMSENLHLFFIKVLGLFLYPSGLLFNVYVLLMYPLTACTALYALRRLGLSTGVALVGSLLFAFLPFHLFRAHRHIFLASYYLVPLQMLMVILLARGSSTVEGGNATGRGKISRKAFLGMLFVSLLVSSGGVYYAFFGCFFLLLAGLYAVVQWGGWRNLGIACFLCFWTSVLTVANLTPSILYHRAFGFNIEAVRRSQFESEMLGLKVVQLLLPITNHRIRWLADLKARYRFQGVMINENDAASLGLIASLGFLLLLVQFLRWGKNNRSERPGLVQTLALLNLGAILLGTIGGFGSLFSLIGTPWIRGYNRISIYIGFLGLAALLLLLDPLLARLRRRSATAWLCAPALAALLALGIYDQTSPAMHPDYAQINAEFARCQEFVDRIEASLPKGAMIFQLPYVSYPESAGYFRSGGYDHLRPYLHSSSLRWSFGAVRGREGDSLALMIATLPPREMLEKMVLAGYEGLFIDRLAYQDLAQHLEATFTDMIGVRPMDGDEHRWLFFSLLDYKAKLRNSYSPEEWNRAFAELAHPVVPLFGAGFNPCEGPANELCRWCLSRGEVFLSNPTDSVREVEVEFAADRPFSLANLHVQYDGGSQDVVLGPKAQCTRFHLTAPPGKTRLVFTCDGKDYVEELDDPRQIQNIQRAYRLLSFQVSPVRAVPARQITSIGGSRIPQ